MTSITKFKLDNHTVNKLFEAAGITGVIGISPLGAGEYNEVLSVSTKEKEYAIKIAPVAGTPVLTYEKNMMASELFWYEKMRTHTPINVPEIYFSDFSRERIPADYFIMEKLPGVTLDKMKLSASEKEDAAAATARMVAQIHKIKNDRFGYIQNQLYDDWYQAIRAMVSAVLDDCARKGHRSSGGEKLLRCIDENAEVLKRAECCMVNFDLWASNIVVRREAGSVRYSWIDPERSYWGDPIVDFVCLELMKPIEMKKVSLAAYNAESDCPIELTKDERIRYAVALGYLSLIMEVEKYYRYTRRHWGWWRNAAVSKLMFSSSFKGMKGHRS